MIFSNKSRDQLIEIFNVDENIARDYYDLKIYEHVYFFVKAYPFEKFISMMREINKLKINNSVLNKLAVILKRKLGKIKTQKVIEDLLAGRPLTINKQRVFRFPARVKKDADTEEILLTQNLWALGLKSLLLAHQLKRKPRSFEESLKIFGDRKRLIALHRLKKLFIRLKMEEKINFRNLSLIGKDLRFSLCQRYKRQKNQKKRVEKLSDFEAIMEYLNKYLPDCQATKQWKKIFQESVSEMEKNHQIRSSKKKLSLTEIELTFLDKNLDFLRMIRFADAASNCFNSESKKFSWIWHRRINLRESPLVLLRKILLVVRRYNLAPMTCVASVNKDPLSFVMDIKEVYSNEIIGFILGRIGLAPDNNDPIIMLSGIYTSQNDPAIVQNILKTIEQNLGQRLGAKLIIIPRLPNDTLHIHTAFRETTMEVKALKALSNWIGRPVKRTFDDFGDVANGIFQFSGYSKTVENSSSRVLHRKN